MDKIPGRFNSVYVVTGVQLSKQVVGGVNVVNSVRGQLRQEGSPSLIESVINIGDTSPMPIADTEARKALVEQDLQRLYD